MFLCSRVEISVAPLQHGEFPSPGLKTIPVGCFVKRQRVNKILAGDFLTVRNHSALCTGGLGLSLP